MAAPSTPSRVERSGNAVAVSIKDFAFGDPLEVAVGTTVTWTNDDCVPHTVTQDGAAASSPARSIRAEHSASPSIRLAAFAYHCEYHANMKSTVTVK